MLTDIPAAKEWPVIGTTGECSDMVDDLVSLYWGEYGVKSGTSAARVRFILIKMTKRMTDDLYPMVRDNAPPPRPCMHVVYIIISD